MQVLFVYSAMYKLQTFFNMIFSKLFLVSPEDKVVVHRRRHGAHQRQHRDVLRLVGERSAADGVPGGDGALGRRHTR